MNLPHALTKIWNFREKLRIMGVLSTFSACPAFSPSKLGRFIRSGPFCVLATTLCRIPYMLSREISAREAPT